MSIKKEKPYKFRQVPSVTPDIEYVCGANKYYHKDIWQQASIRRMNSYSLRVTEENKKETKEEKVLASKEEIEFSDMFRELFKNQRDIFKDE